MVTPTKEEGEVPLEVGEEEGEHQKREEEEHHLWGQLEAREYQRRLIPIDQ